MRFYRSGMWIWAFSVCWGLIVPAVIVFSRVLRGPPQPGPQAGPLVVSTVGLYVVLYLGIVFLIDLPLILLHGVSFAFTPTACPTRAWPSG